MNAELLPQRNQPWGAGGRGSQVQILSPRLTTRSPHEDSAGVLRAGEAPCEQGLSSRNADGSGSRGEATDRPGPHTNRTRVGCLTAHGALLGWEPRLALAVDLFDVVEDDSDGVLRIAVDKDASRA